MTPWNTCVICGEKWPGDRPPICQHTDAEWKKYREDCFKPEDDGGNRKQRRKRAALSGGQRQ